MLVCTNCGKFNDESDFPQKLFCDEFGVMHLSDSDYCPSCKWGDLVEAKSCPICGKYYDDTELDGVCDDCLKENETVEVALQIGDCNRESVEINGFVAAALTADQICHILEEAARKIFKDRDDAVVEYLRDDLPYFTEWVESHNKEN